MPPALSFVFRIKSKMHQRIVTLAGFHDHIAALAAIAARRSPSRNELLPPEGKTAVPAVSGFHANYGLINKHARLAAGVHARQDEGIEES